MDRKPTDHRVDVVLDRLLGCSTVESTLMTSIGDTKYCFTVDGHQAVYLWNGWIHIDSDFEPTLVPAAADIGHTLVLKRKRS